MELFVYILRFFYYLKKIAKWIMPKTKPYSVAVAPFFVASIG